MDEINFWDPRNFSTWQDYRDFWREHLARAGRPVPESFDWEKKFKELNKTYGKNREDI